MNRIDSFAPAIRMATQHAAKPTGMELTGAEAAAKLSKDALVTTAEERQRAKEEAERQKAQENEAMMKRLAEEGKNAKLQAEAMQKEMEMRFTCLAIASRIISGDKVPRGDYQYLAKNSPELFGQALSLRVEREQPRKYKQLSREDEPEESARPEGADATEGVPGGEEKPDAPEAPETPGQPPAEGGPPAEDAAQKLNLRA